MASADIVEFDVFTAPLEGIRLIEASAGTGKTWNICGLYLRLLLEAGLAVDQILVVTFTRAATSELKSRIRDRLVETQRVLGGAPAGADPFVPALLDHLAACGLDSGRIAAALEHALEAFDEAAIFTIHGYCQRALAERPFVAGLPFALEFVEDDLELRLEAARDYWRRHIASDDCPAELGALLVERGDSPERWAAELARHLARPTAEVRWPERPAEADDGADALAALGVAFAEARALWRTQGEAAVATLSDALGRLNANSYKPESIAAAVRGWTRWLAAGDALAPFDAKADKLELLSAERIAARTKKGHTPPAHPFFEAAERLLALRARVVAALEFARLSLLRRFVEDAAADLRALKLARRALAFDDILHNVHRALTGGDNPWLAAELHRRYPAALIDEFQDTDPVQLDIFTRIYADGGRHGRLFLVGDPKQAIYSFRNADLHTYLHARSRADERATLAENQRSVAGLIEACNALFGTNPEAFVLDGLDYMPVRVGSKARKAFIDASAADTAALHVWWSTPASGAPPLRALLVEQAAAATATEAARLIAEGAAGRITIGGRGLAPGDIAVLVRSHRQGARMRAALAAVGVDSVELSQASVFESAEAEELERVLRALAEPASAGLARAALATILAGWDAVAIDRLADDEAALLAVLTRFAALRELWLARGFGVMLRDWLEGDGVARRLLVREDGERRLTNLLHLAELLHEAAAEHASPDALLRWFAARRAEPAGGEAVQLRLESDRNLVQIVTVHRAKGLEYGVVFCPFLWDAHPSPAEQAEGLSYQDPAGGDGPRPVIDYRPEAREDAEVKAALRRERDAEFMRLVYVALTRAVYRGYLVAGCYGKPTRGGVTFTESVRSQLNWLVAGAGTRYADWIDKGNALDPAAIELAWRALATRAAPHVALGPLPEPTAASLAPASAPPEALAALVPPPAVAPGWRIGSFSALARGAGRNEAGRDHDAEAAPPRTAAPPPGLADHDVLRFPRGPAAGDCIHAVFEGLAFRDAATHATAIRAALAAHPQGGGRVTADGAEPPLARMLAGMVEDVLATTLPDGIVLGRLDDARRLVELGFHLPTQGLDAAALDGWLAAHGYRVPRLAFGSLAGYLKGYIDLVFEHGGRFYVLDWKSNHLGYAPEDYALARLEEAMQAHGYHLQHLLYSVALHRHLGRTLPGYDCARHFGGVLYLFVRGVRPHWQVEGGAAGVYFHRTPPAVIAGLDALLGGEPQGKRR